MNHFERIHPAWTEFMRAIENRRRNCAPCGSGNVKQPPAVSSIPIRRGGLSRN